jgi:hypothetical protein
MQNRQPDLKVKVIEPARRNDPLALFLVALVCIGVLFVVVAPKGTFISGPDSAQIAR